MKKLIKLSVISSFLVGGAFFAFTNAAQASLAPTSAGLTNEAVSPRSLYVQNCASCHGSNGKAQTAKGRKLEADDLTSAESKGLSTAKIIRTISNGRGKMPSFKKKMTAAQISSIAGYIRSL